MMFERLACALIRRLSRRFALPADDLLRDAVYRRLCISILISSFGGQVTMLALPLTAAVLLHAHAVTTMRWPSSVWPRTAWRSAATTNTRSQRVAERCGFELEGVLRQHALEMAGRPRDTRLSRVRRDA